MLFNNKNIPAIKMIELTRLNGEKFTLNAFMIEQIQSFPDTTITLTNGKKIVVKTEKTKVIKKIDNYYKFIGLFGASEKQVTKNE